MKIGILIGVEPHAFFPLVFELAGKINENISKENLSLDYGRK
jgi:hypothetical protein